MLRSVITAIAVLVGTSVAADLPPWCDSDLLKSAGTDYPYALRNFYCDGNVRTPHKGEIELVSLTVGPVTYGSDLNAPLLISLPGLSPKALERLKQPLYVRGVQKTAGKNYRLDAALKNDGQIVVDRSAAITPIGISETDLGILVWSEMPEGSVYVPVVARPAKQRNVQGGIELVVRSPVAAPVMRYVIADAQTSGSLVEDIAQRDLSAGSPVVIPIPYGPEELLTVKVSILMPGEPGYSRAITLLRLGPQ